MMSGERKTLTIPQIDDDLDDFAPRPSKAAPESAETKRAIDTHASFPSREASSDTQLNLKGPRHILERFKAICKADRRPYYDMLEILMDSYEGTR